MLRLLWYFLVGYILWKIVQMVMKVFAGPVRPGAPPPPPTGRPPSPKKDFTDIQDADFEDITPKKDPHAS